VRRQLAQRRLQQVAVDVPAEWTELDNAARMRLIQRQAQTQQCELAVITRHEATRKAARQVGIPVFMEAEEALKGRWRMESRLPRVDPRNPAATLPEPPPWRREDVVRRQARPSLHRARQGRIQSEARFRRPLPLWLRLLGYSLIGTLLLALLVGFTVYVLPAATITLTPGRQPVAVTVQLTANPDLEVADLEADLLPGRLLESTIELTGTIPTTGSAQRATDLARGSVVFINLSSTPVTVPSGTIVSTGTGTPVSFRTVAPTEVGGGVGSRATAPIEAVEPGIQGNVRASAITIVEGAMRFRVRVTNQDGTFGGGAQLTPVVTQADRDNLLAQLQAAAQARAVESLQQEVAPGEWLPPETVKTFVIAQAFTAFNDEETAELGLTLRTLVQGVAVNEEEARQALLLALQASIPSGGKLVADSFAMQRLPGATAIDRSVQFTMAVNADYVPLIEPADVRTLVAGQSPDAATEALQARWLLERAPEFYLDPEWTGVLPRLGRRIQVRVEYDDSVTP
jgi:hypothetical protein